MDTVATGIRARAAIDIIAVGLFVWGFFAGVQWGLLAGGLVLVLGVLLKIGLRLLNPLILFILGPILAFLIDPWYAGVFWSIAVFELLALPANIRLLITGPTANEKARVTQS